MSYYDHNDKDFIGVEALSKQIAEDRMQIAASHTVLDLFGISRIDERTGERLGLSDRVLLSKGVNLYQWHYIMGIVTNHLKEIINGSDSVSG